MSKCLRNGWGIGVVIALAGVVAGCPPPRLAPTAGFDASPTQGAAPLTVQFIDESDPGSAEITEWHWDFGDGGTSSEQNPTHTYTELGSYSVALSLTTTVDSHTRIEPGYIRLLEGPIAAFSVNEGTSDSELRFTDASVAGSSTIVTWEWDFGDATMGEVQHPIHNYETTGSFTIQLAVTDSAGLSDTVSLSRVVPEPQTGDTSTFMLPGDVPLEMVWIEPGTFMMGANDTELGGAPNEHPQHETILTEGFWIGKYEVTHAQWEAVMGWNFSNPPGANYPTENISWKSARSFIATLNNLLGETFRMPTEAEWEFACRAGTSTRYYWGNDPDSGLIDDYAWYSANSGGTTHEVGAKLPNAWGLYDMNGNVWEWCQDWLHPDYEGAPADGSAWEAPTSESRVIRGGTFDSNSTECRSATRSGNDPARGRDFHGIRLVKRMKMPSPDLTVNLDSVTLTPLRDTATISIFNREGGVLNWISTTDHPEIEVGPASSVGNTTSIDISATNFSRAHTAQLTLINDDDPTDFEVVDVHIALPRELDETIMLPGDIPLEMVWIEPGTFIMGRYEGELDSYSNESPQHQVTFAEGFWMGRYELTQAQWTAVMETTPWAGQTDVLENPNAPATIVSWEDAQAFVTALHELTGRLFRLPSEAEWEYACRAGTTTRFYWGDDADYILIDDYAWWERTAYLAGERYAHVTGLKLPNAWGLYDMSGNVFEYCQDWDHNDYVGAPSDGSAWLLPVGTLRVFRGGIWSVNGIGPGLDLRSAFRAYTTIEGKNRVGGFRIVMTQDQ